MKHFSAQQFKAAIKSGDKIENATVRKLALGTPEVVDTTRCVKFTISTDAVDRDGDRIDQKGWDFKNFRKNPIVLWGHESSDPPIGRVIELGLEGGDLKAVVEFVAAENPLVGAKAEGIFQMCKSGFINATSVGFQPTEWDLTDDESRSAKDWGVDFRKQELFELSIVSIPANPEALIEPTTAPKAAAEALIETKLNNSAEKRRRIADFLALNGDH